MGDDWWTATRSSPASIDEQRGRVETVGQRVDNLMPPDQAKQQAVHNPQALLPPLLIPDKQDSFNHNTCGRIIQSNPNRVTGMQTSWPLRRPHDNIKTNRECQR